MKFEYLELKNYRNFEDLKVRLSPSINIFLGDNGQGKTNLLESVYFITHGESFRPGLIDTFLKTDNDSKAKNALIRGKVSREKLENQLELRFEFGKKNFFIDKKKTRASSLSKNFPTVLFSPESLSAIKQGPDQRRSLVDEVVINSTNEGRQLIANYRRVLRSRNKLLKDHLKGEIEITEFKKTLHSLNETFFRLGAQLSFERVKILNALQQKLNESMNFLNTGERNQALPAVTVESLYIVSDSPALGWSLQDFYDSIQKRARALEGAEIASGSSLVGPHKHDIQILFNGQDSRYFCSQGQQRALILSFKMAQIVYHYGVYQTYPVLLLDDVMSELDLEKRRRLVDFLSAIEAQILITTTDFDLSKKFVQDNIQIFEIHSGKIQNSMGAFA